MSEAKWTPGPWQTRHARDGSGDVGITAPGLRSVLAECFAAMRHAGEDNREEAMANARLIAAAPDLYEALEDMVKLAVQLGAIDLETQAALAALAKARGEQS